MKITKTYNWNRRDFSFDAKCEHCGKEQKDAGYGYDDNNYYNNVIPSIKCLKCGESSQSKESSLPTEIITTKYDSSIIM